MLTSRDAQRSKDVTATSALSSSAVAAMYVIVLLVGLLVVGCQARGNFTSARSIIKRTECPALRRFPNARYLGWGYNAIKGNPAENAIDPGLKTNAILKFTWNTNKMTTDSKYQIPDHTHALQAMSCAFQSQATMQFGAKSYRDSLSVDVSADVQVGFGLWDARFSASTGYRQVSQGSSQQRRFYTSAVGKCNHYMLSVDYLHGAINVTDAFAAAVRALPLTRNDNEYIKFITNYGTHFTRVVTMGAKMVVRSEFEEIAMTKAEETGLDIQVGARLSYAKFASGGVNVETSTESEQRQKFESMRRTSSESYLGSHPPKDGDWKTWANTTANNPFPVSYKIVPLTSLFISKFFPAMSSSDLTTRRDLLTDAYGVYCNGVTGCAAPGDDRVPLRAKSAVATFHGINSVSCAPSYKLLSCGIRNAQVGGAHDKQRYAIPKTSTACECWDLGTAKCVAWCTNADVQFTTASVVGNGGTTAVAVSCPAGYKVLGCHSKHSTNKEQWGTNSPDDTGNNCHCYDYYGTTCIASCASNIRDHEVRSQYGTGVVTVTCSAGNFVLGCGIAPVWQGGDKFEQWRTWSVKTLDSCECYDYFGATCFALCGKFP